MKYIIDNEKNINDIKNIKDGDILFFKKGTYHLKLNFKANNLTICGEDKLNTIIINDDHYHKIMPDYNECNTFRTYTMQIVGDNCKLENITIYNSATSKIYGQAVALAVYGNHFIANNCIIKGEQDTLFTGPLPADLQIRYKDFLEKDILNIKYSKQEYNNCTIIGDVDFIFGCATAYFNKCDIIGVNDHGFFTAPSHAEDLEYGYLFNNCNFKTTDINSKFFLSRPWRDYGLAYFINCNYDNGILEDGFNKWNDSNRDKTCRFYEYNKTNYKRIYFAKKLNENEAINYLSKFLNYLKA